MGEYLRNTIADPTKKSIMTNVLSRLKSLKLNNKYHSNVYAGAWDVRSGPQGGKRGVDIHSLPDKTKKPTGSKLMDEYLLANVKEEHELDKKRRKKKGEFGGMNQGETEWTEPRDTANDRRDSNFKKKPQI